MTTRINALDAPLSAINAINSAIAVAQNADQKNPAANFESGTKLISSTKAPLKAVKDIAGASSPIYQMVADNIAQQVLQCGINYYNHAPDSDAERQSKAMELQIYAWSIAVGQHTKDRCKKNYDTLKQGVDNMPPAEVAIEVYKINEELRKFSQLPDKISHSVTLITNTKPLLQTIKSKLGATDPLYLSLSTQVVNVALHKLIAEVNKTQDTFIHTADDCKRRGLDKIHKSLDAATNVTSKPQPPTPHNSSSDSTSTPQNDGLPVQWITAILTITIIVAAIGAISFGGIGLFCGCVIGLLGAIITRAYKNKK